MEKEQQKGPRKIVALKVHQWFEDWEKIKFSEEAHRKRPQPHFYLFTLPASELKALSGIYRRTTEEGKKRSQDLGIERRHDESRSAEIRKFVQWGYPWSELREGQRTSGLYNDLLKPGWLPTAIVVNILKSEDKRRRDQTVAKEDLITVRDTSELAATIELPNKFTGFDWEPTQLHPIEVIDGQHRLWAFEERNVGDSFELPVVAFHGLDISWQAYLFWTINIKPKRINASLAYDLYPLLRTEDWLEKFKGPYIYRETRAQELTAALWAHPSSPWHQRINMLGEPGQKTVSQAAWIRSLTATYVKASEGSRIIIGGLFGAPMGEDKLALPWSGAQQAAFLIFVWQSISDAIKECTEKWANTLRQNARAMGNVQDLAFAGPHTLLNTDQGVRGILYITNDLCFIRAEDLKLEDWSDERNVGADDEQAVTKALKSLSEQPVTKFIDVIANELSRFDWRTASTEGLSEEERTGKLVFRGSGGYKELRRLLLRHLASETGKIGKAAKDVFGALGYE